MNSGNATLPWFSGAFIHLSFLEKQNCTLMLSWSEKGRRYGLRSWLISGKDVSENCTKAGTEPTSIACLGLDEISSPIPTGI